MTRDRDNSYPTWLSTRQRRQGVDDGNNYFQYGLEKLPPPNKTRHRLEWACCAHPSIQTF